MKSSVDGIEQLSANFGKVKRNTPKAAVSAINTVARRAVRNGTGKVAKELSIQQKLVRKRARLRRRATNTRPEAEILVDRRQLPLINLLKAGGNKLYEGNGAILVGPYGVERGFKQKLKNGRTHIMQRKGQARYPIDVVKIPLAAPLTNAFRAELKDYGSQIKVEIAKKLTSAFKK